MDDASCAHLEKAAGRPHAVKPSGEGCEECLVSGDEWVHLRLCLTCGHVGCCDESPNKHATKHFKHSQHPVIRSFEPGEDWAYCYPHDLGVDPFPAKGHEAAPQHFDPPGA
jgi:uncharacterized UBP type Zn finger protein